MLPISSSTFTDSPPLPRLSASPPSYYDARDVRRSESAKHLSVRAVPSLAPVFLSLGRNINEGLLRLSRRQHPSHTAPAGQFQISVSYQWRSNRGSDSLSPGWLLWFSYSPPVSWRGLSRLSCRQWVLGADLVPPICRIRREHFFSGLPDSCSVFL